MKYLVKMTPIEPYAFGTDQTFQYHGVEATGKETYFVRSNQVPEQTTILGMLRYIVLEMEGLLNSDFHYTAEEREKMNSCIGRESFRFLQKEKQDFGMIHEISPVFLMDSKNHIYIKNPYHNKYVNSSINRSLKWRRNWYIVGVDVLGDPLQTQRYAINISSVRMQMGGSPRTSTPTVYT